MFSLEPELFGILFVILWHEEDGFQYLQAVRKGLSGEHKSPLLPDLQEEGSKVQGATRENAPELAVLPED